MSRITDNTAACVALIESLFGEDVEVDFTGYSLEATGELRGRYPYTISIDVHGTITLEPINERADP